MSTACGDHLEDSTEVHGSGIRDQKNRRNFSPSHMVWAPLVSIQKPGKHESIPAICSLFPVSCIYGTATMATGPVPVEVLVSEESNRPVVVASKVKALK